jgi:hypothetical protein
MLRPKIQPALPAYLRSFRLRRFCWRDLTNQRTRSLLTVSRQTGNYPETLFAEVSAADIDGTALPPSGRIIKGRPFEVGFECEAELYRKEHPYER